MRDRLIELIEEAAQMWDENPLSSFNEVCADHLLANGVIVPPVRVGQTVYTTVCYGIKDWRIQESMIIKICYKQGLDEPYLEVIEKVVGDKGGCSYFSIPLHHLGKTVFLSREDAERALKGGAE